MHLLDAPATVHELHGQPVEQLWMGRWIAHRAEVVQRADDAAPEVVVPDAIDDHARCEWVLARRDLLCERQPAARCPPVLARDGRWRVTVSGN